MVVAHHWSAAQVRAYRLADNRLAELASWDNDALAIELAAIIDFDETPIEILGWETAEIDLVIDEADGSPVEEESDPADDQVETPFVPVSRLGDTWALGPHRLLCGSSLEGANWRLLLDGESAAMMFTDPPYNVPVSGHVCGLGKVSHAEFAMASGEMSKPEFTGFLGDFVAASLAHLEDGAVLDICMDWRRLGELLAAAEANGLAILNLCVWNKTNGGMGSLYRSKHELVLVLSAMRRQHVEFFLVKAFETLHPGDPPLLIAWYLEAMCHALTEVWSGKERRLVITVPPRHLKSVTASVAFVAWVLGHAPKAKVMVASYSQDLARHHSNQTRD